MANTTIKFDINIGGVATDPTSIVFRDAGGTYGVKRQDTDASVVAMDTALTKLSKGRYAYTFADPAANLTYDYAIQYVYDGETFTEAKTIQGGKTSTNALYDLLPRIVPYLNACPDAVIKQNLRQAMRDFARETWAFQEDITLTAVAGQTEYTLTSIYDAQVLRVLEVKIGTSVLGFTMNNAVNAIKLDAAPAAGTSIVVSVALLPDEDATDAPQEALSEWADGIAAGCLWRLHRIHGTPWFNGHNAETNKSEFWQSQADAKRAVGSLRMNDTYMTTKVIL